MSNFTLFVMWTCFCCVHAVAHVLKVINSEDELDVYDKNWLFQLLVFSATKLPFWILILLTVIVVRSLSCRIFSNKKTSSHEKDRLPHN